MKTPISVKFWAVFLLTVMLSLAWFALIHVLHNPEATVNLASIGWNGFVVP